MSIASDLIRGHTDTIILAQLLKKDSYGYEINKSILQKTDGKYELKEATLYTAFRRLESAGCIVSYWGDQQTGARRRYYSITELGRETHKTLLKDWQNAKTMVDNIIQANTETVTESVTETSASPEDTLHEALSETEKVLQEFTQIERELETGGKNIET